MTPTSARPPARSGRGALLGWAALLAAGPLVCASSLGACGGNVKVDGGGSDTTPTDDDGSDDDGSGQGSTGCFDVPEVVGQVNAGTCSESSDGTTCKRRCDDDANHVWEVSCADKACQCIHDNQVVCLCSVSGSPGVICGGSLPSCCPTPWLGL
jgi:hypothetical protein